MMIKEVKEMFLEEEFNKCYFKLYSSFYKIVVFTKKSGMQKTKCILSDHN